MTENTEFFSRLKQCSTGERAILRRNCGKMLKDADGQAVVVFYRCLPFDVPAWQEDRWFAAACFSCLWAEDQTGLPMEEILGTLKDDSDSIEHWLAALLDLRWEPDGFLLGKLCRMVKMASAKGFVVDCKKLTDDLVWWNSEKQTVQRKWARAMYMKHTDNQQEV